MVPVTVLMAVHGAGPHLATAIDSILQQSVADFKFLIIDDGSHDDTPALLSDYQARDKRIRVHRLEQNRGLGYALRLGVELADTEFVARMDGDDVALPQRLARQLDFLQHNPDIDVLGTCAHEIHDDNTVGPVRRVPQDPSEIERLIWTCPVIHPTVMFRRARILEVGNYDAKLRRRQDYELWFRAVAGGLRFANLEEPLLQYRYDLDTVRRNSMSESWRQARIGWHGCRLVGAPPVAYGGVAMPVLLNAVPVRLRRLVRRATRRYDPRSG